MAQLESYQGALLGNMSQKLHSERMRIEQYSRLLQIKNPKHQVREQRQRLLMLEERLQLAMNRRIEQSRSELKIRVSRLKGLSPLEKLEQGLAYVSGENGTSVYSVNQVKQGETLNIQLKDGKLWAVVTRKEQADVKKQYGI